MSIELAIRSGATITAVPGPTDAMAVTLALVTTPPLVGDDGGLTLDEAGSYSEEEER